MPPEMEDVGSVFRGQRTESWCWRNTVGGHILRASSTPVSLTHGFYSHSAISLAVNLAAIVGWLNHLSSCASYCIVFRGTGEAGNGRSFLIRRDVAGSNVLNPPNTQLAREKYMHLDTSS